MGCRVLLNVICWETAAKRVVKDAIATIVTGTVEPLQVARTIVTGTILTGTVEPRESHDETWRRGVWAVGNDICTTIMRARTSRDASVWACDMTRSRASHSSPLNIDFHRGSE